MSFTERYVTSAASGGGDGSSGNPWTLAEAFANAASGDRVNIQSDSGYSIGATTQTNTGTSAAPIVFRGYSSTIGDLDDNDPDTNGKLDTTGMPAITLTGTLVWTSHCVMQNLNFSGALSSHLVGSTSVDAVAMLNCKVVNTQSTTAATCVFGDDAMSIINCDMECTSSTHGLRLVLADDAGLFYNSRFKVNRSSGGASCLELRSATIVGCTFIGTGASGQRGVYFDTVQDTLRLNFASHNTFYNLNTAIEYLGGTQPRVYALCDNHVTDCSKYLSFVSGAETVIEFRNRTRDNTTPRTNVADVIEVKPETTDTGGASTDYTDATTNEDFTLISTAPGKSGGGNLRDIGAWPADDAAGGSGGGPLVGGRLIRN